MNKAEERQEFQAVTWIAQQLVQGESPESIVERISTDQNPKEKSEQQVAAVDMLVRKFAKGNYSTFSKKKKQALLDELAGIPPKKKPARKQKAATESDMLKAIICIAKDVAGNGEKKTIDENVQSGIPRKEIKELIRLAKMLLVDTFGDGWMKPAAQRKRIAQALIAGVSAMQDGKTGAEKAIKIIAEHFNENS